jgi:hypothetical protein
MRMLQDVLVDEYGLDLTGWQLTDANAISADGNTIVGTGMAPGRHVEAWRAQAPFGGEPGFELEYQGPCPNGGQSGIAWSGGEPNGRVALVYARRQGSVVIQNGPCPGIQLGLGAKQLQLAFIRQSDNTGAGTHQFFTPAAACGGFLQLVDLSRCETSSVVQVN